MVLYGRCIAWIMCWSVAVALVPLAEASAQGFGRGIGLGQGLIATEPAHLLRRAAVRVAREIEEDYRIEAVLDLHVSIAFDDDALTDVVENVGDKFHVPVVLDNRGIADAAVDPSARVTRALLGVPLRSALKLLLDEFDLTFVVHSGTLWITSKEKADEMLTNKVYPVADLTGTGQQCNWGSIMNMITSTIQPDSWEDNGGPGSIQPCVPGTLLVISQKYDVHDEIAELLVRIRCAAGLPIEGPAVTGGFHQAVVGSRSVAKSIQARKSSSRHYLAPRATTIDRRDPSAAYASNVEGFHLVGSLYGSNCRVRGGSAASEYSQSARQFAQPSRVGGVFEVPATDPDDPFN